MSGILVTGMHRSGTSLVTRFLVEGGWHPGHTLLTHQDEQFLEDARIVEMHRRWLRSDTSTHRAAHVVPSSTVPSHRSTTSHHDWGIVDGSVITPAPDDLAASQRATDVRQTARSRDSTGLRWLAKDPRASLYLDVWAAVDDLRFVLVYRSPWDAVDSAVRLPAPVFRRRPHLARDAWHVYNRRLLDHLERHRDRSVLVSSEALAADPTATWQALRRAVELEGDAPRHVVDPTRLRSRGDDHPIASIYAELYPEIAATLRALDEQADIPRPTSGHPPPTRSRPLCGGSLEPGVGIQVVIPCKDDGDFLAEAVASVDQFATGDLELTIVDDGSTDTETLRVLDALRSAGRHIVVTVGVGLPAARNAGCATSRSLAVIPLDADNRLLPALVDALPLLGDGVDVVHGPWRYLGDESSIAHPPDMTLRTLLPHNRIDAMALIRRATLERLGGWDDSLPFWEDWDLWLRACRAGAVTRRLDDPTHDYLVRPESESSRPLVDRAIRRRTLRYILAKHDGVLGRRTIRRIERAYWTHVWQPDRRPRHRVRRLAERHRRRLLQHLDDDLAVVEGRPTA